MNDHSYFYLGYAVTTDAEVEAFASAYEDHVSQGYMFDGDLDAPGGTGTGGGDKIYRLREGIERSVRGEAGARIVQAAIPVLIERPEHHLPGGGNVLYMDGHVEFLRYPGKWPMTERTIGMLESLDGL
jgi:prepilin-type processing-associated H-X9-DG protein